MEITETEAKNRLGFYLSQIEREPVHILKNDRLAAVASGQRSDSKDRCVD